MRIWNATVIKASILLVCILMNTGCGKTGSGDEEAGIVFGEAGAFRLGETREIGYSFTDGQDREISVRNVPSGWQASVDNDANAISLTCGIDAGISGEYSLDVVAKGSNGTETSAELVFRSEIVQGSPFFIGNDPVGVVVLEKTANSDGIIIYKEMPEYDWDDCVDWIETLRETTHLQWEMPGNEDYEVIYEIFNGSDSSTPNAEYPDRFSKWFTDIAGFSIFNKSDIDFISKTIPAQNDISIFTFKSDSPNLMNMPGNDYNAGYKYICSCMAMLKF